MEVDVRRLRFTQETAGYEFSRDGWKPGYSKNMRELFEALLRGDVTARSLTDPTKGGRPLQVLRGRPGPDGLMRLYSCDNRRLCVLKSFAKYMEKKPGAVPLTVHIQFVDRCHHKLECLKGTACKVVTVTKTKLSKSPPCPSPQFTEFLEGREYPAEVLREPENGKKPKKKTTADADENAAKEELAWYMYTPLHTTGLLGSPEQLRTEPPNPGRQTFATFPEVPRLPGLQRQPSF